MPATLEMLVSFAADDARRRGFRVVGIYHLLWAVRQHEPELFVRWLERAGVPPEPFVKLLEALLRPRRAGGGMPRDRLDNELLEQALSMARRAAAERGEVAQAIHLDGVLERLAEDPIRSLCQRFDLPCRSPERPSQA
ncbi:MAG: hypothetical protein GYA21_07445 [Myxococcales bacterium]|nr:hypothetical protein [Myxococcales bacterium]